LSGRKSDFTLIIYSLSSTNRENLANIDAVDFEMTGLTGIVRPKIYINKDENETVAEHMAGRGCSAATAGQINPSWR